MAFRVCVTLVVILYIGYVKSNPCLDENVLKGIVPPVFTPLNDDGTINYGVIPTYAKSMADNGIPGVIVCGTNGENSLVAREERIRLTDAWMAAGKKYNLKVILQVAGLPFPDALKLAKYAGETGVNGILALPEQYYRPVKVVELVYYIKLLADQAPNTPIFYYDYPGLTQVNINMVDFFKNATRLIPTFSGLKTNLATALQVVASTELQSYQRLFVRTDVELASSFALGLYDAISGFCNVFPKLCTDIMTAFKSGNLKKGRDLQKELNRKFAAVAYSSADQDSGEFTGRSKTAMQLVTGIKVGGVRDPIKIKITNEIKQSIAQKLRENGVKLAQ